MNRYAYTDDEGAHLHTLDGKPLLGTSTVAKVIGKGDALTWWASGMAVAELGWLNPKKNSPEAVADALLRGFERIKALDLKEYGKLLTKAYRAFYDNRAKKAVEGTDRHALLEEYVKSCLKQNGDPKVAGAGDAQKEIGAFVAWAQENVEKFLFSEMNTYSEMLWLGGIADCGAILKDGRKVIIDFKSSKDAYPDQFIQCALYDLQIGETGGYTASGEQIFKPMAFDGYLIVPFGAEDITPRAFYNVEQAREAALACLTIYKFNKVFEQ